jgi:uncharacterized repeat protein (TIGR02543 family)
MYMKARALADRIMRAFLAMVLVVGLAPLPGLTTRAYAEGSDARAAVLSDEVRASIDQSEEDGACAAGQALVVYHASGAVKGSTGTLSIQSESDPLASAGFGASSVWDLSNADALDSANQAASEGALSVQSESTGSSIASGSDVRVALVRRDGMSVSDLVAALESLDFVECAQPNYVTTEDELAAVDDESTTTSPSSSAATTSPAVPQTLVTQSPASYNTITNDTYNSLQWGLSGTGSEIAGSTAGIGYASALTKDTPTTTAKDSVVVAVMDTGVDYTNPDLANIMWTDPGTIGLGPAGSHGYNGVTGAYDCKPEPSASHGTHCAGIVAAQTNNNAGVASASGANGHTRLMGLRHETADGYILSTAYIGCYEYLVRARAAGVNVVAVNCSWGTDTSSTYDPVLDYAINQAGKAGVLSCFAAGNANTDVVNDYESARLESPYYLNVASSNESNALSVFSCYNETAVDVAAPGSNILSTVPVTVGGTDFMPLLSNKVGKTTPADGMFYYTDIAGIGLGAGGITYTLYDTKTKTTFNCDRGVTISATGNTLLESNALKVDVDYDKILASKHTPSDVRVRLSWTMTNPFKGANLSDADPSHYAVGVAVASSGLTGWQRAKAYEGLYSGENNLVKADSSSMAIADANWLNSGVLTSLDTTSDTLRAQVDVSFEYRRYSETDPVVQPTGTWSCLLTGYGIGKVTNPNTDATSAFVPYFIESGTSMATPMVTGAVAELAALYPDESPLQLRGRICGGTEAITTATYGRYGSEKHTASDGRFTFEKALDTSAINANTWSITTAGTSVTVHGFNLKHASLAVDSTVVTIASQSDDAITFAADSSLLDGKAHRFDVTDTGTGRTYKASYVTPDASKDSLVRLSAPPTTINASSAKLVSATDRLFYADGNGTYLYGCTDPSGTADAWVELAAPGTPFPGSKTLNSRSIEYTYAEGSVYAFAVGDSAQSTEAKPLASVKCNVYSIASNAWSGWNEIGTVASKSILAFSASAANGMLDCYVRAAASDSEMNYTLLVGKVGSTSFAAADFVKASIYSLGSIGTSLYGLWTAPSPTVTDSYALGLMEVDPSTGKYVNAKYVQGYALADNLYKVFSEQNACETGAGNGLVVAGVSNKGLGDIQLVGADFNLDSDSDYCSATKVGSYGLSSADGLTVGSMCMYGGKLYLNCIDHAPQSADTTGLYTLPDAAASKLATTDAALTSSAQAGGTASVSDWRGSAASSLAVRVGDTATWKAEAQTGYSFDGWYGADGTLVSPDATYSALVDADTALTAHFKAHEYTISFDKNASDATGTMPPQPMTYDAPAALAACAFSRSGYFFAGWNSEADGSGTPYADAAMVENLSADDGATVKLYAQWEQRKEMNGVTAVLVGSGKDIRNLVIEPRGTASDAISSALGTRTLQSDWNVYFTDGTTEGFGTLELSFPASGGTVQVWEVHSGKLFKGSDQAVSNGTASTTVTTLSEFAVTSVTDAVVTPSTVVSPTTAAAAAVASATTTTPSTGDGSEGMLPVALLAATGAVATAFGARRKRRMSFRR